jgi:hypothetical protein
LFLQALPRLTNREKLVQMVDPSLKGQFALKDLVQVSLPSSNLPFSATLGVYYYLSFLWMKKSITS